MDVLKDKKYKQYTRISRYSSFPYYYNTLDDKYVEGTTKYLADDSEYRLIKVKRGDTYDTLALQYYNNPTYYWVICSFNRIQDPFKTPAPDTYLKIPVLSEINYDWRE